MASEANKVKDNNVRQGIESRPVLAEREESAPPPQGWRPLLLGSIRAFPPAARKRLRTLDMLTTSTNAFPKLQFASDMEWCIDGVATAGEFFSATCASVVAGDHENCTRSLFAFARSHGRAQS